MTPQDFAMAIRDFKHPAFELLLRLSQQPLQTYEKRVVKITLPWQHEAIADWMIDNEELWVDGFAQAFGENAELEFEFE